MADVVVHLPVEAGEEAQLFGTYLNRFMEACSFEAERHAATADAPYLMVRSDPAPDRELKMLIFQEADVAKAFANGWARARRGLRVQAN
jgi:hypothetical protein